MKLVTYGRHVVGTLLDMEMKRESLLYYVNNMSEKLLSPQTNILRNISEKNRKKDWISKILTLVTGGKHIVESCLDMEMNRESQLYKVKNMIKNKISL